METSKQLVKLYEDEDGSRRDELNALAPGRYLMFLLFSALFNESLTLLSLLVFSTDRVFEAFYDRLKDLRTYYRKFPELGAAVERPMQLDQPQVHIAFSGEVRSAFHFHYIICNITYNSLVPNYLYRNKLTQHSATSN